MTSTETGLAEFLLTGMAFSLFLTPRLYSTFAHSLLYEISHGCPQPTAARLVYMEFPKLETAALAHVDDSYYYGAYCRKCRHTARLSLLKLRAHLGDDFPLKDVRPRLRCQRCRSRQIVITFLGPHQRSGSLAHMFAEPHS